MKYINQLDNPHVIFDDGKCTEEFKATLPMGILTAAYAACGPCSAIMVLDRLSAAHSMDLKEAIDLAYESEALSHPGTDMKIYGPAFAEKFDLELEMTNDPERLRYCLRTGGAAIVHSGGDREGHIGVFTHGGHYVVAISELKDGRIAILDPSQKDGKYDEDGRKGLVEFTQAEPHIVYCDMQVLLDDTANRDPGFYLFWRKL